MQKREKWEIVRDPYHLAPYAYKDRQWVGYDDVESITLKTRYAVYMGLAGAMIWSIETDDFRGECGPKFPLLNAIKTELRNSVSELPEPNPTKNTTSTTPKTSPVSTTITTTSSTTTSTTTTPSSTTLSSVSPADSESERNKTSMSTNQPPTVTMQTSSSTTTISTTASQTASCDHQTKTTESRTTTTISPFNPTPQSGSGFVCKNSGMIRDPRDCKKFYNCVGMNGAYMRHEYECPSNTVFDNKIQVCMWPQSVPECRDYYKQNPVKFGTLIR